MGKRIVGILQPSYLPWIGYFDYIDRCDTFVFYDDVQYTKHDWRNRNKIKTKEGWQWITVPVKIKGKSKQLINEAEISGTIDWKLKHKNILSQNYKEAPYFKDYRGWLEPLYRDKWSRLIDLNTYAILEIARSFLDINTRVRFSSELGIRGERSERLLKICQHLNADKFLATDATKNYLDEEMFKKAGMGIEYQNYKHPTYPQIHGDFISHLSIVDLLFNCGNKSLDTIRGTR